VLSNGTGQDFVRTYRIPTKVDDAVAVALGGATREVDAGLVRYRAWDGSAGETYFANVGSVGLSGAVARRANSTSKALGGRISFFWALVNAFARWRNTEMTVELDGERRRGLMTDVVVANGQYHGGAMWLAPEASPDDGLFDVLAIGDITKTDFVLNVGKIYRGTHLSHPKIELLRSARVRVEAAVEVPVEIDGEQPGTTPAEFEIVPRALRVRVPA
jgi:YegS/Rv2252/BmrU family lipid kinase